MDWVDEFYSVTGMWWGDAEAHVDDLDRLRSRVVRDFAPAAQSVLELGCGYGATAVALAEEGFDVVAVDLSDRLERAPTAEAASGSVRFVRDDFYSMDLGRRFDVVCYWDGFGVGDDDDQVRLLRRLTSDWLEPDGLAVVEVFHPDGWMSDDGLEEVKEPAPASGYAFQLGHRRSFESASMRAIDTWWEIGSTKSISQSLRCYPPDEFSLLAARAGLDVVEFKDSLEQPTEVGRTPWSFIAVLVQADP